MGKHRDIEQQLAELRISYTADLGRRLAELHSLWASLAVQWQKPAEESLHHMVHSIAGSAETFGYPELTRLARALLVPVRAIEGIPDSQLQTEIGQKLADLMQAMQVIVDAQ